MSIWKSDRLGAPSLETLQAFVLSAELGSFSAAARRMKKAQSAVSTAIANLEIDTGVQLFDRSARSPTLTQAGRSLLPHARGVLLGNRELMAKATSFAEGVEDQLTFAVEQGLHAAPVVDILARFAEAFPTVALRIPAAGPNDAADLLKEGRADLGLMTEREDYPAGFQFRGVEHSVLAPVCSAAHPLAMLDRVGHGDLRQHRQIVFAGRSGGPLGQAGVQKSATVWHAESPALIVELLLRGLGWAEMPLASVRGPLRANDLVRMRYEFQQSDALEGVDVVWTEQRSLGPAGRWIRDRLLEVRREDWRGG